MNEGVIIQVMMMKMMAAISEILPPARLVLSTLLAISHLTLTTVLESGYHDYPYFTEEGTKYKKLIACPS